MATDPLPAVGPYRVIRSLGRGGMGEVFLAHDPRLDRRVALKRIHRREMHGTDVTEAMARFRREARIAAGLDHPGIVRVHDLLEVDGDLVLVMEHVPGRSLREWVDEHPDGLPVDRAMALARTVVRALAHAHSKGVVHRDLKTENVLVSDDGSVVKIADFGIARLFGPAEEEATGEGTDRTGRTATGLVMGTPRAMAPEQIRGGPVDHRADLFALGVLLHELFAGRSPFAAATRADTLARVLTETPRRLDQIAPATPPPVADLAERLLAADPRLRPRDAYEVLALLDPVDGGDSGATALGTVSGAPAPPSAPPPTTAAIPRSVRRKTVAVTLGAAALVALAVLAVLGWQLAEDELGGPVVVAVLPVLEEGGAAESAELASGLRLAVLRSLDSLDDLVVLSTAEVDAVLGGPRQVAGAVGADELIVSRLDCSRRQGVVDDVHGDCRLHLERLDGADASVLWSGQVRFHRDEPLVAAQAVSVEVAAAYPGHPIRPGFGGTFTDPADYAEFLDVLTALNGPASEASRDDLLARLESLRQRSPELVILHLQEARLAVGAFRETRDRQLLERAFQRLDAAERLAPGTSPVLFQRTSTEIAAGRFEAAAATLATLVERVPADPRVLDLEATLHEEKGDLETALALRRRAVERRASWQRLYNLARTAQLLGREELARESLDRLLELAPDHRLALSQLARLELLAGRFVRADELYTRLTRDSPSTSSLTNLGVARLYRGDFDGALRSLEAALERAPDHPQILLNLADAHLLGGDTTTAERLYRRTADRTANDPAADTPALLTVRAQALAHLGRHSEAVEAVLEAVSQSPDDGGVAFEAAVVYALAGEDSSARAAARRAVEQGIEPAWFELPWFAGLELDLPPP